MTFDGATYDARRDAKRLTTLQERVRDLMLDGKWRTIHEVQEIVGGSETSVSARIRDMRKQRWGNYTVESQYIAKGSWRYRVVIPRQTTLEEALA